MTDEPTKPQKLVLATDDEERDVGLIEFLQMAGAPVEVVKLLPGEQRQIRVTPPAPKQLTGLHADVVIADEVASFPREADTVVREHLDRAQREGLGPKRPPRYRWDQVGTGNAPRMMAIRAKLGQGGDHVAIFKRGRMVVVSTLDVAQLPDGSGVGLQWHVSASFGDGKRRLTDAEVAHVLRDFGMEGAEEDNHEPGRARHFWLPVDPEHRVDCECKTTEEVHVEADGHRWSNPRNATPETCNACRFERLGLGACPIHNPRTKETK